MMVDCKLEIILLYQLPLQVKTELELLQTKHTALQDSLESEKTTKSELEGECLSLLVWCRIISLLTAVRFLYYIYWTSQVTLNLSIYILYLWWLWAVDDSVNFEMFS